MKKEEIFEKENDIFEIKTTITRIDGMSNVRCECMRTGTIRESDIEIDDGGDEEMYSTVRMFREDYLFHKFLQELQCERMGITPEDIENYSKKEDEEVPSDAPSISELKSIRSRIESLESHPAVTSGNAWECMAYINDIIYEIENYK